MSEWQPIETAPKDGTRVDLWVVDQDGQGERLADAYWKIGFSRDRFDYSKTAPVINGWWAPNKDYDGQDGYADLDHPWTNRDGKTFDEKPTHWMPLPDPPEKSP